MPTSSEIMDGECLIYALLHVFWYVIINDIISFTYFYWVEVFGFDDPDTSLVMKALIDIGQQERTGGIQNVPRMPYMPAVRMGHHPLADSI